MNTHGKASIISRFARVSASVFVQMLSFQGSTFLVNLLFARLYGPREFGLFSIGLQTLNGIGQTAMLATGYIGARHLGQTYAHSKEAALAGYAECRRIGRFSALATSAALVVLAPWLANVLFRQPEITTLLRFTGIALYFFVPCQQAIMALTAIEAIRIVSIASILSAVIYTLTSTFGAHFFGPAGAMAGVAVSYALLWLIVRRPERELLGHDTRSGALADFDPSQIRKQLLPASLSGFLLLPSTWLLLSIVTRDTGAAQAGIYSAATQIRLLLMLLPQILNSAGLVMVNRMVRTEHGSHTNRLAAISLVSAACACCLLGYLGAPILTLIFGHKFAQSVPVFRALLPAVVLESCILLVRQHLQVGARFWDFLLYVTVPWQLGTLIIAGIIVPGMGATGAAFSYSGGLAIGLIGFGVLTLVQRYQQRVQTPCLAD